MTDGMTKFQQIQHLVIGDLVKNTETAVELAAILIRRNFGEDSLKEQQPLSAHEDGDYWSVDGTPTMMKNTSGFGSVRVRIKKTDASVASLYWDPPSKSK